MVTRAELKQIPILVGLPEDELGRLAESLTPQSLAEGDYACHADDRTTQLVFLVEGRVRVSVLSEDKRELSLAVLKSGDIFGEIAMLTGAPRTADVIALTPCRLLTLKRESFFSLLQKCPSFTFSLMKALATRVHHTSSRLADLVFLDLQTRVLKTLWQIAAPAKTPSGAATKEHMQVDSFLSRKDLASLVGASREAVSRAIHALEEQGHLDLSNGQIALLGKEPTWS